MDNLYNNIEVCFVTTTQYQLLLSDIYSRYLSDYYGIKPIVLHRRFKNFDITKFNTEEKYKIVPYTIRNKNILGQCMFALQCGYLFPFSKWNRLLDRNKRIILFMYVDTSKLSSRMIELVKSFNPYNKVFLIDEGTATYMDKLEKKNERLWYLKHRISKILFGYGRTSEVIGDNPLIDGAIVREPENYKKLKKAKKQTVLRQSADILQYSGQFIAHYSKEDFGTLECDVLYLGQSYYRHGRYYEPEIDCIRLLLSAIPLTAKVLIKPHPRDVDHKYDGLMKDNLHIIGGDVATFPIESLLTLTNPRVVVTIQSSAAITLADMFPEIKCIILKHIPDVQCFIKQLKETGEEVPEFDDAFFDAKNKNVYCPNSLEEFSLLITKLLEDKSKGYLYSASKKAKFHEIDEIILQTIENQK